MNNGSFWEFWVVDSALRGQDPITRFIMGLYKGFWIPFAFGAVCCFLLDINYIIILGMLFKGIYWFIFKFAFYMIMHFDKVVWFCRNLVLPGCCGADPSW